MYDITFVVPLASTTYVLMICCYFVVPVSLGTDSFVYVPFETLTRVSGAVISTSRNVIVGDEFGVRPYHLDDMLTRESVDDFWVNLFPRSVFPAVLLLICCTCLLRFPNLTCAALSVLWRNGDCVVPSDGVPRCQQSC